MYFILHLAFLAFALQGYLVKVEALGEGVLFGLLFVGDGEMEEFGVGVGIGVGVGVGLRYPTACSSLALEAASALRV